MHDSPSAPSHPTVGSALLSRRDALGIVAGSVAAAMFVRTAAAASAATARRSTTAVADAPLEITLAQWSLHRTIFSGDLDPLDFPRAARSHGIAGIELVNQFYQRFRPATDWIAALRRQADAEGVRCHLIMCDGEGELGDPDAKARRDAVERHRPWLDIARELGCHSIRVNAMSGGTPDEQLGHLVDGLGALSDHARDIGLRVVVENHGGQSSDGVWLAKVLRATGRANLGALPDFGNFRMSERQWADRYAGVAALTPLAFAMSAKSHDFDRDGNETTTDYRRMMGIVRAAGYNGAIGIEYEGRRLAERDGILRTKRLLERLGCRSA